MDKQINSEIELYLPPKTVRYLTDIETRRIKDTRHETAGYGQSHNVHINTRQTDRNEQKHEIHRHQTKRQI